MKENRIYMQDARNQLAGNWEVPILTYLVAAVITSVGGPAGLIIGGPMQFGVTVFSLNLVRKKKVDFMQVFDGFRSKIADSIVAFVLIALFTFLWSLLFVIPGIVAAISYSQTFFLLVDNKKLTASEAMQQSKQMMIGKKGKYFCLLLRFTGWFILSILTAGIGFLWLVPYVHVSLANFYDDIKS